MGNPATVSRPMIAFWPLALLACVVTLSSCGERSAADVGVTVSRGSSENTLTKEELSFLLALNASEQASIRDLHAELEDWDFQPHHLEESLRDFVAAKEISLSRQTSSDFRALTTEEADELLDTFTAADDPDYFLSLTEAGVSKWELEDWDITPRRVQSIMFAPHPRGVPSEFRGDATVLKNQ